MLRRALLIVGLLFLGTPQVQASVTLSVSTYLGGSAFEQARDVAVDHDGNIYVAGGTQSPNFPTTPGAYDRTFASGGGSLGSAGPMDVFISKLSPTGEMIWSTYLGGPNYDRAYGIEVDAQGYVYVGGRAGEQFPTTSGTVQPVFAGDSSALGAYGKQDGFVAKLSPDGSQLIWATYFGEGTRGFLRDIDIDDSGYVYAMMSVAQQPVAHITSGAFQTSLSGGQDAVVAKISPDGRTVVWASYFGGSGDDGGGPSIRVHRPTGRVYIVGNTTSADLPVPNGFDTTRGGSLDGFLAVFTADGTGLVYGTYLGGSGGEGNGTHNLAVDAAGNAFACHWTHSADIPIVGNGFQKTHASPGGTDTDCILWKVSPAGVLLANTYLGGNGGENVQGVGFDAAGNVCVSVDSVFSTNFPVSSDALQATNGGGADGALSILSPDLSRLVYSTYIGGSGDDGTRALAVDRNGNIAVAGQSSSADWPARNAAQPTYGGGTADAVAARFAVPLAVSEWKRWSAPIRSP